MFRTEGTFSRQRPAGETILTSSFVERGATVATGAWTDGRYGVSVGADAAGNVRIVRCDFGAR